MPVPNTYRVCGVTISAATSLEAAHYIVHQALGRQALQVHLCNAYTLSLVDSDPRLRSALELADLNLPDGTPVAWLGQRHGTNGPVRGPGLVGNVARLGAEAGLKHYLYGGAPGVAEAAAARLKSHAPGVDVVGMETPPYRDLEPAEVDELCQRIASSGAHVVWVGLGTPRQDYLVPELTTKSGVVVVPVGAAFNFWAGTVTEAPRLLHGSGLEWLYRLASEPRRLWRRYLLGNPRFVRNAIAHRRLDKTATAASPRVVIAYKTLPAYRREFFDGLHKRLKSQGIQLDLVYGDAYGSERLKRDTVTLPWAVARPNRFVSLRSRHLVWQPITDLLRGADLVIVEQASRLLVNYVLLGRHFLGVGPRVALWGHGANLQRHTASKVSEALKRRYSRLPHWWFAYTEGSRQRVETLGFPDERITVVQNAIDTSRLRADIASISPTRLTAFQREHQLSAGKTALFIGGLYSDKRLPFLFEAAKLIHDADPDFRLLVAGDGPSRDEVIEAAAVHPFVRPLGRVDGHERALALRSSDVVLMPGLVGLGILDAFAAEAPLVTTAVDYHSPEIEYLEAGSNGLLVDPPNDPRAYAESVIGLLHDPNTLAQLRVGCRNSAERYTNEQMVQRFADGVVKALETGR